MSDDPDYLYALRLERLLNGSGSGDEREATAGGVSRRSQANEDADYQFAVSLQAKLDAENAKTDDSPVPDLSLIRNSGNGSKRPQTMSRTAMNQEPAPKPVHINRSIYNDADYLNQTQNLVHPGWELTDPTPDVFAMFVRFDQRFFQQRLGAVSVEWSKRMYSCAGICYQRGNRHIKEITIRLSEPLLKLRSRKDLVETLLHEMIHAYCFVLNIREGNGGHGPNFKRIMQTINKVAGTNITVYHTFHDEVDLYKTHVWRCNGICQNHNPFQGWVRRTSNRAPGPNDMWWAKHQRECGGTFVKISEPKKQSTVKEKAKKEATTKAVTGGPTGSAGDIRKYFGDKDTTQPPAKKPYVAAATTNALQKPSAAPALPPSSYPGLSTDPFGTSQPRVAAAAKKVVGLSDLNDTGIRGGKLGDNVFGLRSPPRDTNMSGQGYSLASGSCSSTPKQPESVDRSHLRDLWSKRFANATETQPSEPKPQPVDTTSKRRRVSMTSPDENGEIVTWESYDDDVMLREVTVPIIAISDSEDEDADAASEPAAPKHTPPTTLSSMSSQERTENIRREVLEDEHLYDDSDIIMIDNEYDDAAEDLAAAAELSDRSIIDEFFGEDTLLEEFQRQNDVVPSGSRALNNTEDDITICPICYESMKRCEFKDHLDGCNIIIRMPPPSYKPKAPKAATAGNSKRGGTRQSPRAPTRQSPRQILKNSGYTDDEIAALDLSKSKRKTNASQSEVTPRQRRQRNLFKSTLQCPFCGKELHGHQVDDHEKTCTGRKRRSR